MHRRGNKTREQNIKFWFSVQAHVKFGPATGSVNKLEWDEIPVNSVCTSYMFQGLWKKDINAGLSIQYKTFWEFLFLYGQFNMLLLIKRLEISIACQTKLLEKVLEISLEGILWPGNNYWC